jgi:hypothetical protein
MPTIHSDNLLLLDLADGCTVEGRLVAPLRSTSVLLRWEEQGERERI